MSEQTANHEPQTPPSEMLCPRCGRAELVARHCKSICEQCGYVESCEDNFPVNRTDPAPEAETAGPPSRGMA